MNKGMTSVRLAHEITQVFRILFNTDLLTGFSHSRIFDDGSRAELWTHAQAMQHSYTENQYISTIIHAPDVLGHANRVFFLEDEIDNIREPNVKSRYLKQINDQRELFGHDNPFFVSKKTAICHEFYGFYGPKANRSMKTYIVNHLDDIQKFILKYNDKAKWMIKQAEEDRLVPPWRQSYMTPRPALTRLEKKIAQQASYHLKNKHIAEKLQLSVRTVEGYMGKLKEKYRVDSKRHLIIKLRQDPHLFQ